MRDEDVKLVKHEDVALFLKEGWAHSPVGFLPTDRHAEWGVIMSKEAPMIQPMTITLRRPDVDKAELVITLPNQPSMIVPVGLAAVRLLNRQCAEAVEDWPVQEVQA